MIIIELGIEVIKRGFHMTALLNSISGVGEGLGWHAETCGPGGVNQLDLPACQPFPCTTTSDPLIFPSPCCILTQAPFSQWFGRLLLQITQFDIHKKLAKPAFFFPLESTSFTSVLLFSGGENATEVGILKGSTQEPFTMPASLHQIWGPALCRSFSLSCTERRRNPFADWEMDFKSSRSFPRSQQRRLQIVITWLQSTWQPIINANRLPSAQNGVMWLSGGQHDVLWWPEMLYGS